MNKKHIYFVKYLLCVILILTYNATAFAFHNLRPQSAVQSSITGVEDRLLYSNNSLTTHNIDKLVAGGLNHQQADVFFDDLNRAVSGGNISALELVLRGFSQNPIALRAYEDQIRFSLIALLNADLSYIQESERSALQYKAAFLLSRLPIRNWHVFQSIFDTMLLLDYDARKILLINMVVNLKSKTVIGEVPI
jgi:hypothetical protein